MMRHRTIVLCSAVALIAALPLQTAAASGNRREDGRFPTRPARFDVGAAVASITPPAFGHVHNDAANCTSTVPDPGAYSGPASSPSRSPTSTKRTRERSNRVIPTSTATATAAGTGSCSAAAGTTRGSASAVADAVTAHAIVVSNRHQTIAVEVLDQEGLFNVYQDRIRAKVAADGFRLDGIFISATHDESSPDTLGISGVSQTISGVDAYYVDFLVQQSARAIEDAYRRRRPAYIKYAEAIEPANLRQCFSSYPFVDDQLMPSLQAVATDGRVIATLGDVSQHAETLGFNPDPAQKNWISSDWPHFFRSELEQRFGGVAIEMAGSVGSNETPQVFPGPISRTPQQFLDASHPAGCRTLFQPNGTPVPVGYGQETRTLGRQLGQSVGDALNRSGTWSATDTLWGARETVCITLTNVLFHFGAALGVFAARPSYTNNCTVEIPPAANGVTTGTELQSDVAAFRIGDGEFASVPGEVFPFTFLRSFLGPQDMPNPQPALPPWVMPSMHTPYRFIDGLGEDMIGYIFPAGNGVGVPGEANSGSDVDRFGCGHSDDSGVDVVAERKHRRDRTRRHPRPIRSTPGGRHRRTIRVAGGILSRDPQGLPASLKCNTDTVFTATGPAVAVWMPHGNFASVVVPAAWMSLSGRLQRVPDRNTRGWIGRDGKRHWLDVFPEIAGTPTPRPTDRSFRSRLTTAARRREGEDAIPTDEGADHG